LEAEEDWGDPEADLDGLLGGEDYTSAGGGGEEDRTRCAAWLEINLLRIEQQSLFSPWLNFDWVENWR
jgi:hypothetical protein